jgi:hypothetical protein
MQRNRLLLIGQAKVEFLLTGLDADWIHGGSPRFFFRKKKAGLLPFLIREHVLRMGSKGEGGG